MENFKVNSHYQLAQKIFSKQKKYFWLKSKIAKENPSHISTAYENRDGSLSQGFIALDIDYDKTIWEFKNSEKVKYKKILNLIFSEFPFLKPCYLSTCRSSGGKGIHIVFAVSPYQIVKEEFQANRDLFKETSELLWSALNDLGIGCDFHALGENRLTMNWLNPRRRLDFRPQALSYAHARKGGRRRNILSKIFFELKKHRILEGRTKRELCSTRYTREVVLYPHKTVEPRFAELMAYVLEEKGGEWHASISEMARLFKIKPQLLRAARNLNLASGFAIEKRAHGEWVAFYKRIPSRDVTSRVSELTNAPVQTLKSLPRRVSRISGPCHPSQVELALEGARNEWLVNVCVNLKRAGVEVLDAAKIVQRSIKSVPGSATSRKCRQWPEVVHSIYKRKPIEGERYFLPLWLRLEIDRLTDESLKPLPPLGKGAISPKKTPYGVGRQYLPTEANRRSRKSKQGLLGKELSL